MTMAEHSRVIVIGGGQSGLVAGFYLKKAGIPFVILDAGDRVGQSWRSRWDSLELFTIAQYCELPEQRFPGRRGRFPSKDEMADYVERYAREHQLPVRLQTSVTALAPRAEGGWRLETSQGEYTADQVIVATGAFRVQYTPPLAEKLDQDVYQVHTGSYRNPGEIPGRDVLVVGAANSGAQIATELTRTHRVTLAQGSPLPHFGRKFLFKGLHWWGDKFGIIGKPLEGERDRLHKKTILVGPSLKKIAGRTGMRLAGRAVDAGGRTVHFEDGSKADFDAVVWATGFRWDYRWIDAPVFNEIGMPEHYRGVTDAEGLYFLGMQCQYSYGSGLIWWVKFDAEYLVRQIAAAPAGLAKTDPARAQL
ncbi:MAG: NAD(P)-binding domain-containing protein [Catenulispora sp.]|nr:NAD(P)-binding domain-containing protein [Catenulispora sp.]